WVLRLRRTRMVAAVVLVHDPQIDAVVVTAGSARHQAVGQQRTVVGGPLTGGVDLGDLGGDVPAPRLAVHEGPARLAEVVDVQLPQGFGVLRGHPDAVSTATVGRAGPCVAL